MSVHGTTIRTTSSMASMDTLWGQMIHPSPWNHMRGDTGACGHPFVLPSLGQWWHLGELRPHNTHHLQPSWLRAHMHVPLSYMHSVAHHLGGGWCWGPTCNSSSNTWWVKATPLTLHPSPHAFTTHGPPLPKACTPHPLGFRVIT